MIRLFGIIAEWQSNRRLNQVGDCVVDILYMVWLERIIKNIYTVLLSIMNTL